jgi:tryptophan synthase alpha chain
MSRISGVFNKPGHKALIPYVTVGYPDTETTLKAIVLLAESGADIIELGIPFSDPLADGATIQESSYQALLKGVNTDTCLDIAHRARKTTDVPLVFMTYYNPVLQYGLEKFCRASAEAGIDGLIVPDLPPEESTAIEIFTKKHELDLIYLLAPTSTPERIRMVAEKSGGYIYLVSVAGVTGARSSLPPDLMPFIARVRQAARQPLCVGFGISTPEQAGQIGKAADGVIIGSKLINLIKEDKTLDSLADFIRSVRKNI